ncbi:MAG: branched-chain amino acid ABC transporter permease [Bryobacteraceae bacterium]|nr:branched-chain amino acid ABC transporter permease [Bryobacteraceae bacterium]
MAQSSAFDSAPGGRMRPSLEWGPYIAVLATMAAIPFLFGTTSIRTFNLVLLMGLTAQGLNIIMGMGGMVSVASAALLGIGGFLAGHLSETMGVGIVTSTLLSAALGMGVGVLLALPGLRLKHLYFATATMAMHFIIVFVLQIVQNDMRKGSPFSLAPASIAGIGLDTPLDWYVLFCVLSAVLLIATQMIRTSSLGRALIAIRDDQDAAEIAGVNTVRAKFIAFTISSGVIAAVGAILAFYQMTASWEGITLELAIQFVAIVIVGGMGFSYGPILGAFLVVGIPDFIVRALDGVIGPQLGSQIFLIKNTLFGLLVIYFMTIGPDGVPGALRKGYKAMARFWRRMSASRSS